jgi:hypothetical protein
MSNDLTGRQQRIFTDWLESLPNPPPAHAEWWTPYQQGWRDSGAEKLREENQQLRNRLKPS